MNIIFSSITKENKVEILNLSVNTDQFKFIETTFQCLKEADIFSQWNHVGIYVDKNLIGFAMY